MPPVPGVTPAATTPAATPTPAPTATPTATPVPIPVPVDPAVLVQNTQSLFSRIAANVGSPLGAAIVLGLAGLGAAAGATVLAGSGPGGGPAASNPVVGGASSPGAAASGPIAGSSSAATPAPIPTASPVPANLIAVCPVTAQQAAGLVPGGRVPVMTATSMNGPGQALVDCGYSFAIDHTGVSVGQGSRLSFVEVSIAGPTQAATFFAEWSQGQAQSGADGSATFNDLVHGGVGILQNGVAVGATANATCELLQKPACNAQINGILEGFLQASLAGNPIRPDDGSSGPGGSPVASSAPILEVGPIQATFDQAAFATTYSVQVSGNVGSTTYQWSLQAPAADPTCRKFGVVPTDPRTAIWHHGDQDGCNHAVEGPNGHQGVVTVVISDSSGRRCTATYAGTNTGTGNPAMCTTGDGSGSSPAPASGGVPTAAPASGGPIAQPPSGPAVASSSSPLLGGILGGFLGGLAGIGVAGVVVPARKPKRPVAPVAGAKKKPRDCKKELDALNKADARLQQARAAARSALAATDAAKAAHDAAHDELRMAQSTLEAVQSGQQVSVSEGPQSAIGTIIREESSTKGSFKPATAKDVQKVEMTHRMTINEAQRGVDQATAGVADAEANLANAQAAQGRADDAEAAANAAYQAAREAYSSCVAAQ